MTAVDPEWEFLCALDAMRREMDRFALALAKREATDADRDRMARLFEDFAGVIRVTLGTRQIEQALGDK